MRRALVFAVLILVGAPFVLLASGQTEQTVSELRIGTASMGGAYYPIGQGIANLIGAHSGGLTAIPVVTEGAVQNPRLLEQGDVELALTNANIAYFAYNGTAPYEKKLAVSAVANLYPSVLHVMTLAGSSIETFADLKGKRVAVGPAGGGTLPILQVLLEAYGLAMSDITPSYLAYADGFTQLADGNVDAALALAGYPTSAVMEITATKKIKSVRIDADKLAEVMKKYPYYSDVRVPKEVYKLPEDAVMVGVGNILLASDKLDEATVLKVVQAIFDHLAEFGAANATARQIDPARGGQCPIPLHPGAAKYFEK